MEHSTKSIFSRKFILSLLFFLGSTVALYTGQVDYEAWVATMKWILGIYAVSNVGEHSVREIGGAVKKKAERETEAIRAQMSSQSNESSEKREFKDKPLISKERLESISSNDVIELDSGETLKVTNRSDEFIITNGRKFKVSSGKELDKDAKIANVYKSS